MGGKSFDQVRASTAHATQSFTFGRPPSVNMNFVDCELPPDNDVFVYPNTGEKAMGCA